MIHRTVRIYLILLLLGIGLPASRAQESTAGAPFQATGVKVGEVTSTSAIIWTRLTFHAERLKNGVPLPQPKKVKDLKNPKKTKLVSKGSELPEGVSVDEVEGAVPGAAGEVRVAYAESPGKDAWTATPWLEAVADRDFTNQFVLEKLRPNTEYVFRVECRARKRDDGQQHPGPSVEGRFRTAPDPGEPARVVFTVVTGQMYWHRDCEDGYKIYPIMAGLNPSFFVHTGDILYYDAPRPIAKTAALARYKWHRIYSLPSLVEFHREVPSYFIKDDHDTWQNDCWPAMKNDKMGEFTFEQGQAIFREQVPMGECTYRTVRWGKDLQVWLMEGRDFRSPNTMPDGPDKTIWGAEEKQWFKRTVRESDASFKVLISPTPIVGPDRTNKADNHANAAFAHEGREIRQWIRDNEPNLVIACGDRHWQYVSVDPETGVREYSCGPVSDQHAGGFPGKVEAYHRYFNVVGGFLAGTVERINNEPTLTFRHYSVDGKMLFEDRLEKK